MEWHDEAIILGSRRHGETSLIVEVMTREHGRALGLVKGGRSKRQQPMLQPGNKVNTHWWARLDEHLGLFRLEVTEFQAAKLIEKPFSLYLMQLIATHLRLLPERDPHQALYDMTALLLKHADQQWLAGELMARFEIRLLEELGFGLDLSKCVVNGTSDNIVYVSPKSGCAVSDEAGAPWHDKLLPLPQFLRDIHLRVDNYQQLADAFELSGFFMMRHIWQARGLTPPVTRDKLLALIAKSQAQNIADIAGEKLPL